jgi:hypothetical protein
VNVTGGRQVCRTVDLGRIAAPFGSHRTTTWPLSRPDESNLDVLEIPPVRMT